MFKTKENKKRECELTLDHEVAWGGDGYFCVKCELRFVPFELPQPTEKEPSQETKKGESWRKGYQQGVGEEALRCFDLIKEAEQRERERVIKIVQEIKEGFGELEAKSVLQKVVEAIKNLNA